MAVDELAYRDDGLIPVVVQDVVSGAVLMHAYATREAVEATLTTGLAHFYSRRRGRLWMKGEYSGNVMRVLAVVADCDLDALLYLVVPSGPACHTGARTCFHNVVASSLIEEARRVAEAERVAADPYALGLAATALAALALPRLGPGTVLAAPPAARPHLPVALARALGAPLYLGDVPGPRDIVAVAERADPVTIEWAEGVGARLLLALEAARERRSRIPVLALKAT